MKKILSFAAGAMIFLLLLPLTVMGQPKTVHTDVKISEITQPKQFTIYKTAEDKTEKISYKDYIFGVVAAEMPATYEPEALKAQAVAACTFALYRKNQNANRGYDITDDFKIDQAFISEEKAREKWGENADEYAQKIKDAVSQTENLVITYNNEIALAVYHAISFGKTEYAQNVWGGKRDYLTSVSSIGDKLSPNFISTKTVSTEELKSLFGDIKWSGNGSDYFKNIVRTEAGGVKSLKLCGNEMTGADLREKLDLRSTNFEIKYENNTFTFTVYGYGHAVGMSQYGANYMAQQGADYKEILLHYYQGCKIQKIE